MKKAGIWSIFGLAIGASVFYFYLQDTSTETPVTLIKEETKESNTDYFNENSEIDSLYKIWVRSFSDSNNDGHGDLAGITSKLEYLKKLGVKNVLLSPIFKSPSYHGYEVSDYLQIQPEYGSENDLVDLINQAASLGIDILLDVPLNHTSDQHPWFLASVNNEPKYSDFYVWYDYLPQEYGLPWLDSPSPTSVFHTKNQRQGYYYGVFGYASPDLNFKNPDVVSEIKSIISYWLDLGVKGFRIDAARYLIEDGPNEGQRDTQSNFKLLEELTAYARNEDPDIRFIGEVFASDEIVKKYLERNDGLDSYFNFQFGFSLQSIVKDTSLGVAEKIQQMQSVYDQMPFEGKHFSRQIALLSNQDLKRISLNEYTEYKLLYSLFLTTPFAVSLYYGEEIALASHQTEKDIFYRGLMSWDCGSNSLKNTSSSWLVNNLNQEDSDKYQAWLDNKASDSLTPNCNQLNVHISKLLKLRGLQSEYFPYSGYIETELSNDEFFITGFTGSKNSLFIIVNMDTTKDKIFNLDALPFLNFTNVTTKENYEPIDSVKVNAADVLILLGH